MGADNNRALAAGELLANLFFAIHSTDQIKGFDPFAPDNGYFEDGHSPVLQAGMSQCIPLLAVHLGEAQREVNAGDMRSL